MTSGGTRNRSGPRPDPNSLRGANRDALRVLPNRPFDGAAPEFPLPHGTVREEQLWEEAWKAPQAWAWIEEPWRWQVVALWVRRTVLAESEDANASDVNAMIRLADQIGMTPAGLKENGWTIGVEAKSEPAKSGQSAASKQRTSAKNRFTVVDGDGQTA